MQNWIKPNPAVNLFLPMQISCKCVFPGTIGLIRVLGSNHKGDKEVQAQSDWTLFVLTPLPSRTKLRTCTSHEPLVCHSRDDRWNYSTCRLLFDYLL